MKTKKSNPLPIHDDVQSVTYHRNPTPEEIKFGHGATHYLDFPIELCKKKDGSLKTRVTGWVDGLIYSRSRN